MKTKISEMQNIQRDYITQKISDLQYIIIETIKIQQREKIFKIHQSQKT